MLKFEKDDILKTILSTIIFCGLNILKYKINNKYLLSMFSTIKTTVEILNYIQTPHPRYHRLVCHPICHLLMLEDGKILSAAFHSKMVIYEPKLHYKVIKIIEHHDKEHELKKVYLLENKNILSVDDFYFYIWKGRKDYRLIAKLKAHNSGITCIEVLPKGKIFTASGDGKAKIWEFDKKYKPVQNLEGINSKICAVTLSRNKHLVTHSADGIIMVWYYDYSYTCVKILKEQIDISRKLLSIDNLIIYYTTLTNETNEKSYITVLSFDKSYKSYLCVQLEENYWITKILVLQDGNIACGSSCGLVNIKSKKEKFKTIQTLGGHMASIRE
jgi:WD40 repeat protein